MAAIGGATLKVADAENNTKQEDTMGYEKLSQSVVTDQEAQFAGDVEATFFEMPYLAGLPPVAPDKSTTRLYTDTAGHTKLRDATGKVLDLTAGALAGSDARSLSEVSLAVAATTTKRVFRALTDGAIREVAAEIGTVAAAAESLSIDILIAGVSALTAPIVIDSTVLINTPVEGLIDATSNEYVVGDLITVSFAYTAGGGPTPMANAIVGIGVQSA
jgi:hypothetical protein